MFGEVDEVDIRYFHFTGTGLACPSEKEYKACQSLTALGGETCEATVQKLLEELPSDVFATRISVKAVETAVKPMITSLLSKRIHER